MGCLEGLFGCLFELLPCIGGSFVWDFLFPWLDAEQEPNAMVYGCASVLTGIIAIVLWVAKSSDELLFFRWVAVVLCGIFAINTLYASLRK